MFSAGDRWTHQFHEERIPVPGRVLSLFLPSRAVEVEWAVSPSKPIFYGLSKSFDWAAIVYPETSVLLLFTHCSSPFVAIPQALHQSF